MVLLAVLLMHIRKHKKVQSTVANMVKITYIVYQCICSCLSFTKSYKMFELTSGVNGFGFDRKLGTSNCAR